MINVEKNKYRISMLSEAEALKRGKELGISEYISKMNIFRVLMNHPQLAEKLNSTVIALVSFFDEKSGIKDVSDRLREIIIMRVSWKTNCDYEWSQHYLASLYFGLAEPDLVAIRDWRTATCFSAAEQAVLAATDDLLDNKKISPAIWLQLKEYFKTDKALIEVVTCIGNWHMFALILNGLAVPLDEGMKSWAPDGKGPA